MSCSECYCGGPNQCIVPPHMLDAIRLRGNVKQRKMVAALEKQAIAVRDKRQALCRPGIEPAVVIAADAKLPKPNRSIHDGQHKATLPGPLARNETTGATNDKQVNDAFVGSGDVFNMYLKAFGRNSLDGNGLKMISTVHHRRNLNNAFWNGVQMAYGDGDGVLFKPLTGSLSVIGHELSHGVVQYSGGLNNDAFVGSGDVFNMYLKAFGRNSLDGNGLKMISTVHHRRNLNNAFWNGVQMAYGDGDGVLFKPLTGSLSGWKSRLSPFATNGRRFADQALNPLL